MHEDIEQRPRGGANLGTGGKLLVSVSLVAAVSLASGAGVLLGIPAWFVLPVSGAMAAALILVVLVQRPDRPSAVALLTKGRTLFMFALIPLLSTPVAMILQRLTAPSWLTIAVMSLPAILPVIYVLIETKRSHCD